MQPRIIPRSDHPISRKNIDPDALKVLYRLYRSGHTAFLVGGGVRDLLIGRRPKDFDVCTSARPGQVKKLFRNCWLIGRRFRLAHIHFRDHKIVEVSTFRAQPEREGDGDEDLLVRQDNTFGTPEEDALRRDFTINGLFYDIASFSLIDYVGGVEDIEAGVIRTIGDPHIRFQEDPVRMLRAIKFAARLDFAIEPETWEALCEHAEDITKCSTSRVVEEIARILEGGAACRSLQLLKASGLLRLVLPEVFEYIHGVPAGPGLILDSRGEARETTETIEEDLLLNADEDTDAEVQERLLPVDGEMPDASESDEIRQGESDDAVDEGLDAAETEIADDDEVDLSGDDGPEVDVVTPQGTRCVQAPDRGGLLWRMLSSLDERVRASCPMTRSSLYAALFYPVVRHTTEWLVEQSGRDEESAFMSLLRPLTATILVSRRDRERVCQILAAQRKFKRNNKGFAQALSRKPYFAEALDVYEVTVLATGMGVEPLAWWRTRYPYVAPAVTSSGRARPVAGAEGREGDAAARRSRRRRRPAVEGRGRSVREFEREPDDGDELRDRGRERHGRELDRDDRDDRDDERVRDRDERVRDRDGRVRERDDRGRERDDRGRERIDRGREREDRGRDREDRGRDREDRGRDREDRGGRDRSDRSRDRDDRGRGRDDRSRDRDDRSRDRDERSRGRARDDEYEAPAVDRSRGARRGRDQDRDYDRLRVVDRDRGAREPVDEFRGEFRRREMRDIEPLSSDYGRVSSGRGSSRSESVRSTRGGGARNGAGRERTTRRTPYREEGYRGPRGRGDELEYYESRVGHDLTPESPRPRRDDDRRGGRRRRRKPPTINR